MFPLMFLQQLVASSTHIVAKSVTSELHPTFVVLMRALFSCLLYGTWMIIRRKSLKHVDRTDWRMLVLLGLLNIPLNQFLFIWGVKLGTAPNAALAYAVSPTFVLIILAVMYRERPSRLKIVGVIIAFIGTAIVLVDKGVRFDEDVFLGTLIVLGASLAWAFYTVFGRNLAIKYGAMHTTSLSMLIGTMLYIPIWILLPVPFDPSPLIVQTGGPTPLENWLQLFYLGVVTSGLGFGLWYYALTKYDAAKVSVFNNLQPVMTTILSFLLFSQVPTPLFVIGGVIALGGVILTQRG